ncbi:hypothetical protein [Cellulosimicrobium sp. SH8]|uniref:hypothetical protein n=1 Tax=Cellulosimicrobium sp. SH8 TaxID=2952936 RepID=UPI0021F32B74|nr:hypothetical protein [Cellulosimicrobium sp. SH8]
MKRPRFRVRRSSATGLWYVFDRSDGAVVSAPTHEEAIERCRMLAVASPTTRLVSYFLISEPTA